MGRAIAICLAATALGVALMVLLPEDLLGGGPLFTLNDRHGPGRADAIGLVIILGGWLYFQGTLWVKRHDMRPRWLAVALTIVSLAALFGCIAAFRADRDSWAFLSAGVAVAAQFGLAALCHCKSARHWG